MNGVFSREEVVINLVNRLAQNPRSFLVPFSRRNIIGSSRKLIEQVTKNDNSSNPYNNATAADVHPEPVEARQIAQKLELCRARDKKA